MKNKITRTACIYLFKSVQYLKKFFFSPLAFFQKKKNANCRLLREIGHVQSWVTRASLNRL